MFRNIKNLRHPEEARRAVSKDAGPKPRLKVAEI
jgi:hypothetical protein